ncbi:hypothetical protein JOE21_001649 [Desmospora profundinema]|uniref:Uncharacterized protein n=1 Tax=Desmospora profundinema TaxID=1571184 RepID=A0ABU1ILT2_9BACL|nr:hypothetical protein [Desmospora profundinema]
MNAFDKQENWLFWTVIIIAAIFSFAFLGRIFR